MSAPSPLQLAGSLVSYTIATNGQPIDSAWQVISIDIWAGVNTLPRARITIADGNAAEAAFAISEASTLIPGTTLAITLGYDETGTQVFSGIIDRQGLEQGLDGSSLLIIEASDPALAMTLARRNAVFEGMTDSAVIERLITATGLTASVTPTAAVEEAIVQYHASDWDLMLARAAVNSMVVTVSGGQVVVAPPDTTQSPVLTLTNGESILDFRTVMDAATQYAASAVQSVAWDPATQELAMAGAASSTVTTPGNLSSDILATAFGVDQLRQQTSATIGKDDLTRWSSARLTQARLAKIRGHVRFRGSALARPGCMITLAGLGARFNGNAYVSGVHQQVVAGNWTTEVEIGLAPQWAARDAAEAGATAASAAGQIPAAANLQTGLVTRIDGDPDGEYRVLVALPLLEANAGVWARLGGFYASRGVGALFYPEVGDEVVVAFMNGDPRFPVIMGSLYSKKNPPPVPPTAANDQKTIVTYGKLRIDFFETDGAIELSTPAGQIVRLDDKAGTVTVEDRNENSVTLATDGITIDSAARITLNAKAGIAITAQGILSLAGKEGVTIEGPTIQAKADASFSAHGAAEAILSSGGIVTVQGQLVKIDQSDA
ncbi:type VI secretion system tip protein VgrG [Sphingomonas alpina]|uniref:Type VI secretion system tip protein VgrG n=1 Tax=Sphingomonas alpina TaxID=653931 RepID=A0A7H0LJ61_9SPHN|nr:type VI secretion system tip protein VgrG [Sphingomonas alpina]QNQ09714.1 type VI secretion system tip protein VgrG [Sphingomonas alpina]